ncbi:MAG TPA: mechanosensitive ion channel domain-containing protein [Acidobacteriota bacterium]|nr:mechanosensitive ion channel domain-containing protein [Acidobacteriota bacterium]
MRQSCRILVLAVLWLGWAALCCQVSAQTRNPLEFLSQDPDQASGEAEQGPSLQERMQRLDDEMSRARSRLASAEAQADSSAERHLALLEQIESLLDQLQTQQNIVADLREEGRQLDQDLQSMRDSGPRDQPPYSFLRLSAVRSELRAHLRQGEMLQSARQALQAAVASANRQRQEREADRRRIKENLEGNTDSSRLPRLSAQLRTAELESWVALERLNLRRAELEARRLSDEIYSLRSDFLREQVAWLSREAEFPRDVLARELAQIRDHQESSAERQRELREQLQEIRGQVSQGTEGQAPGDPLEDRRHSALRSRLEALQTRLKLENEYQTQLGLQERIWSQRFSVFHQEADNNLEDWSLEAQQARRQLEIDRQLDRLQGDEARQRILTLQQQLEAAQDGSPEAQILEGQIATVQSLADAYEIAILRIDDSLRLVNGLQEEISLTLGGEDLGQRLSRWWDSFLAIWYSELTSVDDQPITVAKIIWVLLLLIFGLWISRRISQGLGKRLFPRMGLDEGSAAAAQALFYYTLVVIFALIALYAVNVPLTAFTVAGGALAIGIGFGSQNVVRNFISGIILLTERPIRVGDLVQIDDLYGTIKRIGLRSTQVLSAENVDIVVPNSSFLEQNVVNWTLSDDRYRAKVTVGVAYGSPTRDVVRLMERAVSEHGKVLKTPHPILLFSDFGDNALIFEVHFWLRMRRLMDSKTVQSDLRHRIDHLFREAGITIAFPQRDVHLDSLSPIEVRLRKDSGPEEESEPKPAPLPDSKAKPSQ